MNTTDVSDTKGCLFVYSAEEFPFRSSFEIIALTIFTPIIVALGSMLNLAFLFVLYRIEEMQTLCNFYLANLTVADLGNLLTFGGSYIDYYINSPKFETLHVGYASKHCALFGLYTYAAYSASVFFLSIVIFDRYMAICFPLKHMVMKRKPYVARLTCILWKVSFCMAAASSIYTVAGSGCIQDGSTLIKINFCIPHQFGKELEVATILLDSCQFFFSFSACIFMTHIIHKLSVRVNSSQSAITNKTRNKITRMLIINATIFFLCQFPYQIFNMDYVISDITGIHIIKNYLAMKIISWAGRVTNLVNSSINPILYSMVNDRYRKAFKAAFHLRCLTKESSSWFLYDCTTALHLSWEENNKREWKPLIHSYTKWNQLFLGYSSLTSAL